MEVVDEIGECAENEQQTPDPEVDTQWMLLALPMRRFDVFHAFTLPEIEECKDENPHEIDEVPVQARDLHCLVTAFAVVISAPDAARNDAEENAARRHVQAVKAGDHEECRSELRRAPQIAPRAHALMDQLRPFERLHADEHDTEAGGD